MLRIGLIGCGKIADQHAATIKRILGCKIVGVCDNEELMAKQLYERFNVEHYFSDVKKLLDAVHPDIVHITTSPQSHFELGRTCLEAGCNVYIEKPFTLNTPEAEMLIELAKKKDLKLTVGHNIQYSRLAVRMRELIKNGFLGGPPVHMESTYCYNLGDVGYAKALLGDENHWIRALPGKLLHNIISHGISRIVEYLSGDCPKVIAYGFVSPFLRSIGENDIIDELRVIISDSDYTTAYFTFSSQISPPQNQFRICGPKNSLVIDEMYQTLIKYENTNYKSFLKYFLTPSIYAKNYFANSCCNVKQFIKNEFHDDSGMKCMIESFYRSVMDGAPLPISYKEIILTSKIMDAIFEQLNSRRVEEETGY